MSRGLIPMSEILPLVVLVTVPNREVAEKIAKALVEARLAACVNIVDELKSIYWWQGKIEEDNELLLIIKTRMEVFEELVLKIRELHPYTVPEIIGLPIIAGSKDYIDWLKNEVKRGVESQ